MVSMTCSDDSDESYRWKNQYRGDGRVSLMREEGRCKRADGSRQM